MLYRVHKQAAQNDIFLKMYLYKRVISDVEIGRLKWCIYVNAMSGAEIGR